MLALYWGVVPVVTTERDTRRLEQIALERRLIASGSVVVFINVSPDLHRVDENFLNVQQMA